MERSLPVAERPRRPEWMKVRAPSADGRYFDVKKLIHGASLNTVCEEARCPNLGECFSRGTATFMLLGDRCTRRCSYCSVGTGRPLPPDPGEPERVAAAAVRLGLRYVVLTSVNRDDLADGGAEHFAATVAAVRRALPQAGIEVLTPDFQGERDALATLLAAEPTVFNHNIETVPRLFRRVRPQGAYRRSLDVLAAARELRPDLPTKSGLMVGLGEEDAEIRTVLRDLLAQGVSIVTIGQYLRPSRQHEPVDRYLPPEAFAALAAEARALGFGTVYAGVFVRSSYNALEVFRSGSAH
jgi:lipoic acid synthetase